MFIINKSDILQRTSVKGVKKDIKPGEIVDVNEYEFNNLMNAYGYIFGAVKKEENIIETKPVKKRKKTTKVIKSNKK